MGVVEYNRTRFQVQVDRVIERNNGMPVEKSLKFSKLVSLETKPTFPFH